MNQVTETLDKSYNASDFIDGQQACRKGEECPANANESFLAGFSSEYQLLELKSNGWVK